ncbi:MAG TPA: hypothetical protein VMR25_07725 [Planctomycetaceae bacterium]|jgi:hypothetical protein|nr:hypothetical protein [Planctomycetaceae bacterium]
MMRSVSCGWISCVCLALAWCGSGCGKDIQAVADQHVRNDMLDKHEKRPALPFFEKHGQFFDLDSTSKVDQEVVVPLLKKLNEIAATQQWAMLRPEQANSAYGILIELPKDPKTVDRMAEAVQQADDKFSGFILQQWGHEWLLIDLIDQQSYETLKKADPDIDKQR